MYNPTLRLLTILELLQARNDISGADLAQRLEVDGRSVRRYITMLQDLGIPVESVRGRHGSYRLRPGFNLPPLMFSNEEAVAVTLGLLTIQSNGLAFAAPSIEGAIAKIERVLPVALRERIHVLQEVVAFGPNPRGVPLTVNGEIILHMAEAVYKHQQIFLSYRSEKGEQTARVVDPYGLAFWAGRWYMVGYCHLREDVRAYRLDRIREARMQSQTFDPPADFDCMDYLVHSFGRFLHLWDVEVLLKTTLAEAQAKIPDMYGSLETATTGVIYRCRVDNLPDAARFLIDLRFPFVVAKPPELRTALHELATEIHRMADASV